ncbi:MAG: T9SS type A sorting domain-containing protein, partial [Bacteroidota bacterium]|nr:T9SS type A sorting domain-containing protein [Bacteroidota bacterium]
NDNEVYLTFKQLGALLVGTESIFVLKSFDGGTTFPQSTEATLPEFGVQPDDQGNIAVDQNNGNVYTVFIGHPGNSVYVARSTDRGKSFTLLLVHQGPVGASYQNVFPIIAVDRGSNLHVVYSDGTNVYLTSSSDQGTVWTAPVRVNNGTETKTALAPWVDAGDAGKVDIMWWATPSPNSLAADAQWKVYFAQTQNAFAKTPSISENAATGIFHTGPICVNGTGCASGTRDLAEYASATVYRDGNAMIVYPDNQQTSNPLTYFIKQTGGAVVIAPVKMKKTAPAVAKLPDHFALDQNYPNPFNPSTTISFALPANSFVQLTVYNILGQEVAMLVNEEMEAGTHIVRFDASRLPSGVYFYKLAANGGAFVNVKRMVIMK